MDVFRFKISKVPLIMNPPKHELASFDAKLEVLRDAQATVEQNVDELSGQRIWSPRRQRRR